MILKRKKYDRLLEWKNNSQGTKAIMVEGARRIGTWVCQSTKNAHMRNATWETPGCLAESSVISCGFNPG